MYREARALTRRDESFVLDVVHDAMLKVIRSIKPFSTDEKLESWLRTVVKSCALDLLRREARRIRRERKAAPSESIPAEDAAPDRAVHAEQLAWLRSELVRMGPDRAAMLHLRHQRGWTLARIGTMLGLSTGAVDGRINRTMAAMKVRSQEKSDA